MLTDTEQQCIDRLRYLCDIGGVSTSTMWQVAHVTIAALQNMRGDSISRSLISLRMRTMIDTLEYLIENGYCDHKPVGRERLAQAFKKKLAHPTLTN